ncbi:MAG TPA: hypothetical protein P5250_00280 [Bacteroidales bacterium]|nr:hypothetical protein [Bacteroidales bacterium]
MKKEHQLKELNINVYLQSESPTRSRVKADTFEIIIDEPESFGGTNMGPTPVQVLLMSLAGVVLTLQGIK